MDAPDLNTAARFVDRVFNGRFRLIRSLGEGGMGSVFLLETNDAFRIRHALKIIEFGGEEPGSEIFSEIETLKKLDHPAIPKIIEVARDDSHIYIVQEFIEGLSLRQIIAQKKKLDDEIVILWMSDTADAIGYLHSMQIIHRDIKPGNIMINTDGHVKLIDFGLARHVSVSDDADACVMGTRQYTPPERYLRRDADIRTDIYAFGTTFYYLITGVQPLDMSSDSGRHMRVMRKELDKVPSSGIKAILKKCIDINPDKRYQDFGEIRYEIGRIDAYGKETEALEKKKKARYVLIGILFAAAAILLGLGVWQYGVDRNNRYETYIGDGETALAAGDMSEAADSYQQAIDFDRNQWAGYQGLYETYTAEGRTDDVINGIQELFANRPKAEDSAKLLYLLGNAYYEKGDYAQAEPYLKDAVDKEATVENKLVLGLNYSAQQQYDKALEVMNTLKEDGGDASAADYLSGQIYERQGNTSDAEAAYRRVIASTTDHSLKQRAYLAVARLDKDAQNYQTEIADLEQARSESIFENDSRINEMLGQAYYYLARNGEADTYDEAAEAFTRVIESGWSQAYIYRDLAIIYQKQGNYDKASDILDEMEAAWPDNYTVYVQRSWLILEEEDSKPQTQRNYSKFEEVYKQMLQKAGSNSNDAEIQQLKSKYAELQEKGWL